MKDAQLLAMARSLRQSIDMRSNEAAQTEVERFKIDLFSQNAMLHSMRSALLAAAGNKTLYVIVASPYGDNQPSVVGAYFCEVEAKAMCERLTALDNECESEWDFSVDKIDLLDPKPVDEAFIDSFKPRT